TAAPARAKPMTKVARKNHAEGGVSSVQWLSSAAQIAPTTSPKATPRRTDACRDDRPRGGHSRTAAPAAMTTKAEMVYALTRPCSRYHSPSILMTPGGTG